MTGADRAALRAAYLRGDTTEEIAAAARATVAEVEVYLTWWCSRGCPEPPAEREADPMTGTARPAPCGWPQKRAAAGLLEHVDEFCLHCLAGDCGSCEDALCRCGHGPAADLGPET